MMIEFQNENMKGRRIKRAVAISADMFLKNGIENVKMTDIADASGVGVATLYRYFGTKTGITIAAMTHLWNELKGMFSGIFESEVFLAQSGLKQLSDLMRMYTVLYEAHKDFMKLLGEFDLMMIREKVPKSELEEYDQSIINFYVVYDKDLDEPIADGFYFTIGYPGMTSGQLAKELMYYGVSAICLITCGSEQEGLRVCTSFIEDHQYAQLEERMKVFEINNPR